MSRGRFAALGIVAVLAAAVTVQHLEFDVSPDCAKRAPGSAGEIISVVPSSNRAGLLYASSDRGTLFVSRDGGAHWLIRSHQVPGWIAADIGSGSSEELLAVSGRGLFASANGGLSWKTWSCSLEVAAISATADGGTVWVGAHVDETSLQGGGLYRTSTAGKSWMSNFNLPDLNVNAVLVDRTNPRIVVVGTEAGGLSRTIDGGAHFEWRTIGQPSTGFPHGEQVTAFAASSADPHILWAGTRANGIFRGIDDARFWSHSGLNGDYVDYLAADQQLRNRLYAGEGASPDCSARNPRRPGAPGTYLTLDGQTWNTIATLPGEMQIEVATPTDTIYAWCNHTIFSTANHGESWRRLSPIP